MNEIQKSEVSAELSAAEMIFNDAHFSRANQLAEIMASGRCAVPQHLRGNVGDCFAIIVQAAQWRMNPFVVAQKTHVVNGTLGYESQLVNAVVTAMGVTSDRFRYEYVGDWDAYRKSGYDPKLELGCGVNVGATLKGETEVRYLPTPLCMENVKTRNSPLWKTNPQQQIAYLAVKYWARLYAPDAILGIYTPDELAEGAGMNPSGMVNITPEAAHLQEAPKRITATETLASKVIAKTAEAETVKVKAPSLKERMEQMIQERGYKLSVSDFDKWLATKKLGTVESADKFPDNWKKWIDENLGTVLDKLSKGETI